MKIVFTRPTQIVVIIFCILTSSFASSFAADSFEVKNYIEAILGVSRGPLAALSYQNNGTKTGKAKVIHCAADLVRIAHEICSMINHKDDGSYSLGIRGTWVAFDTVNLYNDLFAKNLDSQNDDIELSEKDKKFFDRLIKVSQLFLFPTLESITALYQALPQQQTPQNQINQRQAQSFCSLARAASVFLNNQQSEAAIALLLAALSETMLATHASISFTQTQQHNQIVQLIEQQTMRSTEIEQRIDELTQAQARREAQEANVLAQLQRREAENAAQNALEREQQQIANTTIQQEIRELAAAQAGREAQEAHVLEQLQIRETENAARNALELEQQRIANAAIEQRIHELTAAQTRRETQQADVLEQLQRRETENAAQNNLEREQQRIAIATIQQEIQALATTHARALEQLQRHEAENATQNELEQMRRDIANTQAALQHELALRQRLEQHLEKIHVAGEMIVEFDQKNTTAEQQRHFDYLFDKDPASQELIDYVRGL